LALPVIVPSSVFGADAPSNRIAMGCIGVGGQGSSDMRGFKGQPGCEIVAVCDVDAGHRDKAAKSVGLDANSSYNDFRDLLARTDIDAVSIATPDHWHVPRRSPPCGRARTCIARSRLR
jgi:predicted homoserine dehydrogenase-like protein